MEITYIYVISINIRSVLQNVPCRTFTAETKVRFQFRPSEISGGGIGDRLYSSTLVSALSESFHQCCILT
jgi:hypothetical protein